MSDSEAAVLPFPLDAEPSFKCSLRGDLRAGVPRLLRGSEWCRLIDDDRYRLHARAIGDDATDLRWTGIHVPPGCVVRLQAACAITESKPVRATLWIGSPGGEGTRCTRVFAGTTLETMTMALPGDEENPLSAALVVEPLETLAGSDRAVIDLLPIEVVPTDASRGTGGRHGV